MASRYVYSYYLNDLPIVNDRNHILNALEDIPKFLFNVAEGHVNNYKTIIALGIARSMEDVEHWLSVLREKFIEWNKLLDEYGVNEEMRFDIDDLPDAVGFYRLLFRFMPEEECEAALARMRERLAAKKANQ